MQLHWRNPLCASTPAKCGLLGIAQCCGACLLAITCGFSRYTSMGIVCESSRWVVSSERLGARKNLRNFARRFRSSSGRALATLKS